MRDLQQCASLKVNALRPLEELPKEPHGQQAKGHPDDLLGEAMSPIRHEWLDGEVWAMAAGTPDRAAIAVDVTTLLSNHLRGRPCRVFGSDLRIRVRATGLGTYPDASVICGKVQFDPQDRSKTTATNPKVLVEVLSPSTEQYDLGEKLVHYKKVPSLDEIVRAVGRGDLPRPARLTAARTFRARPLRT